jgi:hypothetical protein
MAQFQKQTKTDNLKKKSSKKVKAGQKTIDDLFTNFDNFLKNKQNTIFWIFFGLSVLFSVLLFDLSVSVGGDDSTYIIKADNLIKDFSYPSFQGPLYPIILSPFLALFGINLPILKLLSFFFVSGHLFFFFRAFKNNIPPILLIFSIALISINSYLLFFASQTYSEALFLMTQALFFLYFFKNHINQEESNPDLKKELTGFLLLGLMILLLGLVKSVGYAALFAVVIYFLFQKKWKQSGYSIAGFAIVYGLWQLLKYILWGDNKAQFSDQASSLLLKHPYDPGQGMETFGGFVQRFLDNSNAYISRQLFKILGLRPELIEINNMMGAPDTITLLTILVYSLFIFGLIWSLRKNKYLLFTGIYMSIMMGVTFIILQPIWEAHRLIITLFPLIVIFSLTGIYGILKLKKLSVLQFVFPILLLILFLGNFSRSATKIKEHQKIFNAHLRGNITAGFTPDWVNFINMSIWAAENVPADKVIASRKPSISFIYTNRRFFGIYKVETTDADSLLNYLHEHHVEYVIMASLRKIEAQKTDQTINTIQRYLYYIQLKYPEKLKLIQQIGANDDEPAFLFKIE